MSVEGYPRVIPITVECSGPTTLDPPFLAPIECVVDLPFPPSTNKIWRNNGRGGTVSLSPVYRKWKAQADVCAIADRNWRSKPRLPAAFTALILLDREQRAGDVDNRIKAVLDWAQSRELIKNDGLCEEVTARWVATPEAPRGCRIVLRSVA